MERNHAANHRNHGCAAKMSVLLLQAQNLSVAAMNALLVIAPYKYQGTWVFDDPAVGLSRKPFIAEIGTMRSSLGCSFRAINGHRRSNFSVFATTPAVAYPLLVRPRA